MARPKKLQTGPDKKRPLNLTITNGVYGLAEKLVERRHYTSISVLVEELVRAEWEKRFPGQPFPPVNSPSEPEANPHRLKARAIGVAQRNLVKQLKRRRAARLKHGPSTPPSPA